MHCSEKHKSPENRGGAGRLQRAAALLLHCRSTRRTGRALCCSTAQAGSTSAPSWPALAARMDFGHGDTKGFALIRVVESWEFHRGLVRWFIPQMLL